MKQDQSPASPKFVLKYGLILLGVAFFLVLLSYLSHVQQGNEQQWAEIQKNQTKFSVSAMESIDKLQQENSDLKTQLDRATQEQGKLERDLAVMESEKAQSEQNLAEAQEKQSAEQKLAAQAARQTAELAANRQLALDYLWRLERLVSSKRYTKGRALLAEMQEKGLDTFLSGTAAQGLEPEGVSPAEEYNRLVEILS